MSFVGSHLIYLYNFFKSFFDFYFYRNWFFNIALISRNVALKYFIMLFWKEIWWHCRWPERITSTKWLKQFKQIRKQTPNRNEREAYGICHSWRSLLQKLSASAKFHGVFIDIWFWWCGTNYSLRLTLIVCIRAALLQNSAWLSIYNWPIIIV